MNSNQCIFCLSFWHRLEKRNKIYCIMLYHNGICQRYSMNNFFPKDLGWLKKKGHAHKQTMMRLFEFLTFYYSFLLLTVFFLKEAVHQRAFCSYIVIFLQRKILYNLFFFLLKTISGGISSTHIIIPYIMIILFPMPSSGDNSWSVCQLLGRTYSLNINQRVALTDL